MSRSCARVLSLLVLLLAGCNSRPFSIDIRNVDGPRSVDVSVNGQHVARVVCGDGTVLALGQLPDLPWDVRLTAQDGAFNKEFTVPRGSSALSAYVRGQDILVGPAGSP